MPSVNDSRGCRGVPAGYPIVKWENVLGRTSVTRSPNIGDITAVVSGRAVRAPGNFRVVISYEAFELFVLNKLQTRVVIKSTTAIYLSGQLLATNFSISGIILFCVCHSMKENVEIFKNLMMRNRY